MLGRMNYDRSRLMGVPWYPLGVCIVVFQFGFDCVVRRFEEGFSDDDFLRCR